MSSEFRFAARALARWRGGAVAAVLTLAVGIGATTGLYALVRLALAEFPGVPHLDRVARVYVSSEALGVERSPVAVNEVPTKLAHVGSFASIGAYAQGEAEIGSGEAAKAVTVGYAMPGFFAAMGVPPAQGRVFSDVDARGTQPVALVSDALWRRDFAGRSIDGASIRVDGVDRAVIGVMPAEFSYVFVGITADVWLPLAPDTRNAPPIATAYARLRPGITWAAAGAELRGIPASPGPWTWRAIPLADDVRYRAQGAYAMTFGPALVVLLIACVNVACMLLARGIARDKELSVRHALGASRLRIARQLLAENLLLALAAGALGYPLAMGFLRVISAAVAAIQPAMAARLPGGMSLLPIALGSSLGACLLFGMVPTIRLSRRDVAASLNGVPPRVRVHIAGYGARDAVVFAEMACAVGLIVWSAMIFNLFRQMDRVTPGFAADSVIAVRVTAADLTHAAERVAGVPGVAAVTTASALPGATERRSAAQAQVDGVPPVPVARVPVGDAFFTTIGLPLTRGRTFDAAELRGRAPVAILSESAARRLSPGGDPIGLRIRLTGRFSSSATVIGVCRDALDYGGLLQAGLMPADVYVPYEPSPMNDAVVLARTAADPRTAIRAVAAAALPDRPARVRYAAVLSDEARIGPRDGNIFVSLLGGFALIALVLAASGVFGVISQSVAQRTTEFGIRLALGAAPRRVLGMVLAREAKLIVTAIACGALFTIGLTRALFQELIALSALAPALWVQVSVLCGGLAAGACALATYRIIRLEPAAVLRRH